MFDPVIASLPDFATFLLAAIGLLGAFTVLYILITPYNEIALIRVGNEAAAISLGGALIGLSLPIAVAVAVSHSLPVMLGWGGVACAVQLLAFMLARLALPGMTENIRQGRVASGIFLAALSIGLGILNAGCII